MLSHCDAFIEELRSQDDPLVALESAFGSCSDEELAVLNYSWDWWARPTQIAPDHNWRSWGALTGRGWGKTRTFAEFTNIEVFEGRAHRIALIAQNEEACLDVLVHGESGLISTSPPWFKARYELGRVIWPNGAQAFIYSPEAPDAIFGPEHDMAWLSEIHGWPRATMLKAFSNLRMGLRLGLARMIWDSNPRRKHPIIKLLLERAAANPIKHVVIRGTTFENLLNLNPDAVQEWIDEYGGTQTGREMLNGEQLDEEDGALFKQAWIDRTRREMPAKFKRRILVIDPAISTRKGTDKTGIVEMGLGVDDQIYVILDHTGKHAWEAWGDLAITRYEAGRCDCIIVERNRGGDACLANLRARAEHRGIDVVKVADDAPTHYVPGVIYVKEVIGRVSKESRAEPVASLTERGRVSFVIGSDFTDLEEQLTTYEDAPGAVSPNNYDAFVWGVWELAGLAKSQSNTKSFAGVETANRVLKSPPRSPLHLLFSAGRGRTI